MVRRRSLIPFAVAVLWLGASTAALAADVVVYSARKEHLIKPLFDAYTKKTGVEVTYVTDKAGALLQRLKSEGKRTKADLLITVDAGNLWHAAEAGLLQPTITAGLQAQVPEHLRDPEGRWYGLSVRARTVVYSPQRVKEGELTTYEALGTAPWKNRLCLRTSKKVYNQSLVAMLIAEHGEARTEEIVSSWVGNLATPPFSNDTKVMEAILAGQCDAGIVNTYYFGRLLKKDPDLELALFWPNQDSDGVHVNISGAGVVNHSRHPAEARKLLEWLASEEAQSLFADVNMEYPVNPAVAPHEFVAAWGEFKPSTMNLAKAGELQVDAIRLMDRAGYR